MGALLQPILLIGDSEHFASHYCWYWSRGGDDRKAPYRLPELAGDTISCRAVGTAELWSEAAWLFIPSLAVGTVLTITIAVQANELACYLPAIWMLLFGLGVWSAAKLFSRGMIAVALYYFITGKVDTCFHQHSPFSPYFMICGFGIGQILMTGVIAYDEKSRVE